MKLSKEAKTGILVTSALGIFFIGFYFLKGANLFSNNKQYYCFYSDIDGLQNSANVQVRGLIVGHVSGMKLVDNKGVKVELTISKSVEITEGTVVSLTTDGLLATKSITIKLGPGPGKLESGTMLPTEVEKGLLDNVSGKLTPRLEELKTTIANIDTALAGITAVLEPIKTTAKNLAALTGTLNQQSGDIIGIMHNLNSFTTNLALQNDSIKQILSNFNRISRQISNAPIQKTVAELQTTVTELKGIMDKINNSQGSLGLLVNDKGLYNNLNSAVISIQKLTDDLKAHPGRYVNISVFGGKKKD